MQELAGHTWTNYYSLNTFDGLTVLQQYHLGNLVSVNYIIDVYSYRNDTCTKSKHVFWYIN